MALYREGKWPPQAQRPEEMAYADPDIDVMRFAGRPGFVSAPEPSDSLASTPETTADTSSPGQAHPLLFEYLKRFQSESGCDAHGQSFKGPATATFPPEQSMLPPIMPGSEAFIDSNGTYLQQESSIPSMNGSSPTLDPSKMQDSMLYTSDWATMLSTSYETADQALFGSSINCPTDFVPPPTSNGYQYSAANLPQPANTENGYVWDQFLSGLIPQDA